MLSESEWKKIRERVAGGGWRVMRIRKGEVQRRYPGQGGLKIPFARVKAVVATLTKVVES